MTLPARLFRDPLEVLINKEAAIEIKLKGCRGCKQLMFDASGDRIIALCKKGRKVGRKGKCSLFSEAE